MGNCFKNGLIEDGEIFVIKIKLNVLFPDVLMTEKINKCPHNIKKEAIDYLNSMNFKTQINYDINQVVKETPRYMLININNVIFEEDFSEVKIYCIINIHNKNYQYIPTYTEFRELAKQAIIDGFVDKGYPHKNFKRYFGPSDKEYKLVFQENDLSIDWY